MKKGKKIKCLIDRRECELLFLGMINQGGPSLYLFHEMNKDRPIAQHLLHRVDPTDNFRVIANGVVYVFNHNPSTYQPLKPETYAEYWELRQQGKRLWAKD